MIINGIYLKISSSNAAVIHALLLSLAVSSSFEFSSLVKPFLIATITSNGLIIKTERYEMNATILITTAMSSVACCISWYCWETCAGNDCSGQAFGK